MRTRWIDAGAPTWRKSWRRPDLLMRALKINTVVNCRVFHNYDSSNAERSFEVRLHPGQPAHAVGPLQLRRRHLYGGSNQTTSIERGGTMGRAGTIQLLVEGQPGISWGLNGDHLQVHPTEVSLNAADPAQRHRQRQPRRRRQAATELRHHRRLGQPRSRSPATARRR